MSKLSSFSFKSGGNNFRKWQEIIRDYLRINIEQRCVDEFAFRGSMRFAYLENIYFSRISESGLITSVTKSSLSSRARFDTAYVRLQISGKITSVVGDREIVQNPGELMIIGIQPCTFVTAPGSQALIVEIPEELLKDIFGKRYNYEFLKFDNANPTVNIVGSFIDSLENSIGNFDQHASKRMAQVCSDLIADAVFSNFCQSKSISPRNSLVVLRAKAYIDANLGRLNLDPSQVADALGVPLRQLQILFQEQSESISEWIWMRRVEGVAKRLKDPKFAHMQIGVIAYSFGFTNHAHFTRRFRKYYDMSPRDFKNMHSLFAP